MQILIFFRYLLVIAIFSTSLAVPQAYSQPAGGLTREEKSELTGTRKQLATIVFAGLAGAILGLSTLSFYGRPQEHLDNIAIGGALGIIAGTIYSTYKVAKSPYDVYDLSSTQYDRQKTDFTEIQLSSRFVRQVEAPVFSYHWSF